MKPYTLLLGSVLDEDKDLSYSTKIEKDSGPKEDNYTVLIVFIFPYFCYCYRIINLALFMIVIKKRNQKNNVAEDENEMSQKLYSNNFLSEVDP